jgi:hypothetical protein
MYLMADRNPEGWAIRDRWWLEQELRDLYELMRLPATYDKQDRDEVTARIVALQERLRRLDPPRSRRRMRPARVRHTTQPQFPLWSSDA